jgi:hypothetical protein
MKNVSDPIGNRTVELSACSAVPQPTAPPHAANIELVVAQIYALLLFSVLLGVTVEVHSYVQLMYERNTRFHKLTH